MDDKIINILKMGGVGVLLTDTLYGLVAQALNKDAVARVYRIKTRDEQKPLIILISSIKELEHFAVKVDSKTRKILNGVWPGPVSVILPCLSLKKFEYLHRGTKTLAFRLPKKNSLLEIIKKTGPLVAPSANPEGLLPARNIGEAKGYFGNNVDFYLSGSKPKNKPSTIIRINNGVVVVRK